MGDDLGDDWGVEGVDAGEEGISMVAAEAGRELGVNHWNPTCGGIVIVPHDAPHSQQCQQPAVQQLAVRVPR